MYRQLSKAHTEGVELLKKGEGLKNGTSDG